MDAGACCVPEVDMADFDAVLDEASVLVDNVYCTRAPCQQPFKFPTKLVPMFCLAIFYFHSEVLFSVGY